VYNTRELENFEGVTMKRTKSYSILKQLSIYLILVYCLLFSLMLINDVSAIRTVREKICGGLYTSLNIYSNQIETSLSAAEKYLIGMSDTTKGANLLTIERDNDDSEFYRAVIKEKIELDSALTTLDLIEGLFVFSTTNQTLIASAKVPTSPTVSSMRNIIRAAHNSDTLSMLPAKRWFPIYVNNQYYLLRIFKVRNSYVGAWANISSMLALVESEQNLVEQALFVFDGDNVYANNSQKSSLRPDIKGSLEKYTIFDSDKRYLCISIQTSYTKDGYIAMLIPDEQLSAQLRQNYILMLITGCAFLLLALVILYILRRFLQRPIHRLKRSIDALRTGDFNTRISENFECEEFIEVNHAFNDMVERIETLKISIYEEKLTQQQLEMKFLKSQIAPHFLNNCLNAIYHMTGAGKVDLIQKMTVTLGEHLRYALSDQSVVSLDFELDKVKNYIQLSKLRFPDCIEYFINIDRKIKNATVLPLMVLSYVENTIKHEVIAGKVIEIHIDANYMENEKGERVLIKIWDTGDGWPPDIYSVLSSGKMLNNDDGHHIGIKNIYQRMKFIFEGDFEIHFSNRPNAGAEIELEFPYTPIEKDSSESSF